MLLDSPWCPLLPAGLKPNVRVRKGGLGTAGGSHTLCEVPPVVPTVAQSRPPVGKIEVATAKVESTFSVREVQVGLLRIYFC